MPRKSGHRLGAVERERSSIQAWSLYLQDIPIITISRMMGLNRETVSNLINLRREEEITRLQTVGSNVTDDFRFRHAHLRARCFQMLNRIENAIFLDDRREQRLEEVLRERAARVLHGEGTLEEEAGVLVETTRALRNMMSLPPNFARLAHVIMKSMRDEALILGLLGRGSSPTAIEQQRVAALRASLDEPMFTLLSPTDFEPSAAASPESST
jgi:hypothetical protein